MKNENELTVILEQSPKLRRWKSREVGSRFQSPSSSFDVGNRSPVRTLSPVRRKPEARKTTRPSQLDDPASLRGLWPSASASKADTLADHLGHDRLNDIIERNRGRSPRSELVSRFENDKETKENHRPIVGGSMRYTGNRRFSEKSSSLSSASKFFNGPADELSPRVSGDFGAGASSELGEVCSKAYSRATRRGVEVASKYMNDAAGAAWHRRGTSDSNVEASAAEPKAMKRANSLRMGYGSSKTQWALSPGRSKSPRLSVESKGALPVSFSSLKPRSSPSRTRGVEKLLNLGLDFFKTRKSSSSSFSCSSPVSALNSTLIATHGSSTVSETGQDFWLLHNRLMQWRFANARADFVNASVANRVERNLVCGWDSLTKIQNSVAQKRIQLHKEKLEMKLNFILQSQLKLLECWGDVERQHSAAISNAKESLHSVVCRVPLIEGAKVDTESAAMTFRHALDLGSSIKLMLTTFLPSAEKNVELMSELAKVVAQEKLLLEECLELLRDISILEIKERSLKCCITQMEFWKEQQNHRLGQVVLEISS